MAAFGRFVPVVSGWGRPVLSVTMYGMTLATGLTLLPQDQPCRNDHAVGEMKWAPSK